MWILLGIVVAVIFALFLCTKGNCDKQKQARLRGFCYAHRGLHGMGVAENSMAAFAAAKEKGYGIELDLHLMRDGRLAVLHDSSLKRTTGAEGIIEDMTADDLPLYRLEGSTQTIPLFSDVLSLYEDAGAPIIVELKPYKKNHAALCEATCKALEGYKGEYAIESFDPRCILWLKKHRPDIIRGQLSQNFFKTDDKLSFIIKLLLTHNLLNFLTRPDFVAYRFSHRDTPSIHLCEKLWKMQCIGWTIMGEAEMKEAESIGWLSIFEHIKKEK